MRIVPMLYKIARVANTTEALLKPKRLPKRAKNIFFGRVLARVGFWRWLWK